MATTRSTVGDVMTRAAVAIGRDASYKEIVELMHTWRVGSVPVLEGEGRVVGVVSEADLLPKEGFREEDVPAPSRRAEEAAKAEAVLAEDLMSSPAVTVHADATLAEAARIMARRRVKRLPVVNRLGMLEGVVSRSDLLKVFLRSDEEIAEEIRSAVLAGLPLPERVRFSVVDGVVTLRGPLRHPALPPLLVRAVRAVEGVVDVRAEFSSDPLDPPVDP